MTERCPECGAEVPDGGSCADNFHALLALEARVPEAAAGLPHFYAVASYVLQHPDGMRYTAAALADLRAGIREALEGRAGVPHLRERARRVSADGRITRRGDEAPVRWNVERWPVTVRDVCARGVSGYAHNVEEWARSIVVALDEADR